MLKNEFILYTKQTYKRFTCFSINTSDAVINKLLGYPRVLLKCSKLEDANYRRYDPSIIISPDLDCKHPSPKHITKSLTLIIQLMYGSECKTHNFVANSEHLNSYPLLRLLDRYQNPKLKHIARSDLNRKIALVRSIANWFIQGNWTLDWHNYPYNYFIIHWWLNHLYIIIKA